MRSKEKGITLIALVITVILLLILAGVTIRWVTTGDSIFKYADIAKKETKRGEIKEYLDVSLVDERTAGYKETVETIIKNTQKRVKENGKSDLSAIAKEVETKEVETKKYNEKDAEYYFYVVVDEEVYKVGADGTEYLGQRASKEVELQKGEISFDYSETKLTKENVKVTITKNTNIEGAKLYYKTKGEKGVEEGESNKWKEYNGEVEIEKNCSIVARLEGIMGDVTKEATGNVQNIDKLAPKTFTPSGSATTNTITVTAKAEDHEITEEYATSGIAGYSFSIDGENWSEYKEEGKYTFEKLTQSKPYTIKVKAKDKVGNEMSAPAEIKVSTKAMISAKESGNITFEGLPKDWTNKNVTVTAKTTSGYKIQTSIDTTNWKDEVSQELEKNGKVYARLVDSTGQYAEGESWATAEVTKIDKQNPNVPTVTLNLDNSSKTNYTSGTWTNQNVKVSFTATDNGGSGIASYEYSANAKDNISAKTSGYLINTDGTTNIYIRAVDEAGNKGSWSVQKIVKRDTSVPTVELTGAVNGATNVKLTGKGTDTVSNLSYGWSANKSTQPSNWTTVNAKTTTIENPVTSTTCFWIKDEAGNTACKLATLSSHTHVSGVCTGTCPGTISFGALAGNQCVQCGNYGRVATCNKCGRYMGNHCPNCAAGMKCGKTLSCSKTAGYTCSIS